VLFEAGRSFQVAADPQEVWAFLWRLEEVAACIPGCVEVKVIEPAKQYQALVKRKMGPFVVGFELGVEVVEHEEPRRLRVTISGRDRKLKTEVEQTVTLVLTGGRGQTGVSVTAAMELNGVLASLGKNLITMQIEQVLDDFVEALRAAIQESQRK